MYKSTTAHLLIPAYQSLTFFSTISEPTLFQQINMVSDTIFYVTMFLAFIIGRVLARQIQKTYPPYLYVYPGPLLLRSSSNDTHTS
jgi:hypothetical protein